MAMDRKSIDWLLYMFIFSLIVFIFSLLIEGAGALMVSNLEYDQSRAGSWVLDHGGNE